jgi:hypothetical protein
VHDTGDSGVFGQARQDGYGVAQSGHDLDTCADARPPPDPSDHGGRIRGPNGDLPEWACTGKQVDQQPRPGQAHLPQRIRPLDNGDAGRATPTTVAFVASASISAIIWFRVIKLWIRRASVK